MISLLEAYTDLSEMISKLEEKRKTLTKFTEIANIDMDIAGLKMDRNDLDRTIRNLKNASEKWQV